MSDTTTHDVMVAQTQKAGTLLDYFQGHRDLLEADRVAHGAAVAAQIGNLKGVVDSRMHFSATVNPNDLAPTNEDGGTFNTIADLVNAAPAGAYVFAFLARDATHVISSNISTHNQIIDFAAGAGNGVVPTIRFDAVDIGTHNIVAAFYSRKSTFLLRDVNVELPAVKANVALPWASSSRCAFDGLGVVEVSMTGGTVTGGEGNGLLGMNGSLIGILSISNTTLDGSIFGIAQASQGLSLVSKGSVTLLNGAALTDGATLGTNLLQN